MHYVLDEGYWKEPFDPTISMTFGGQFFKNFRQHTHPPNLTAPEASFHEYAKLPVELQLRVLQQCDAPTLFQLMHTSRDLRTEAKKLFFSDQKTWYRPKGENLLFCSCPGELMYDVDFLACIEQLDLYGHNDFGDWQPEEWWKAAGTKEDLIELNMEHITARMREYWGTIQRLCPRVKRVMLSQDERWPYEEHPVPYCFEKLAQTCPRGIDVSFYAPETEKEAAGRRRKRVWWQLRTGQGDTSSTPTWEARLDAPGVFVVPPEKPHRGPVGAFIKARTSYDKFNDQDYAAGMHRAAAVEKYHFEGRHEPFGCSVTECNTWFDQPEQYTTHLLVTGHGRHDAAPGPFEVLCAENAKRIQRLKEEQGRVEKCFWDWWGDVATEKRSRAEKEVMDQLEHDALYAQDKPVTEHGLLLLMHVHENEEL